MLPTSSIYTSGDKSRQFVDMALSSGRNLQSSVTTYLHYNDKLIDDPSYDSIPIYENFLFVLTLLRDRTKENIQEAKKMAERLLYFQNFILEQEKGNFPTYLHHYPTCFDRSMPAKLLPIFYWILKQFHLVLGSELRERIKSSAAFLLERGLDTIEVKPLPFTDTLRIGASAVAFGRLWENKQLLEIGQNLEKKLLAMSKSQTFTGWMSPQAIGDTFTALQMVTPRISESPWDHFWKWVQETYHWESMSYTGPNLQPSLFKREPEITLYDFYLSYFTGQYTYRSLLDRPVLLEASLIHPSEDRMDKPRLPITVIGPDPAKPWLLKQLASFSFCLSEACPNPFQLIWGDTNRTQTAIFTRGNAERIQFAKQDYAIELFFTLPAEPPSEAKQKNREVLFYISDDENLKITAGQEQRTTTFRMGEEVLVRANGLILGITFTLESGQGTFFGHVAKGNRPSQRNLSRDGRFAAYDMMVFLRTVVRTTPCVIKASITFQGALLYNSPLSQ